MEESFSKLLGLECFIIFQRYSQIIGIIKSILILLYLNLLVEISQYQYCQNFRGGSFGQVEAVDVGDVSKWRQKLI